MIFLSFSLGLTNIIFKYYIALVWKECFHHAAVKKIFLPQTPIKSFYTTIKTIIHLTLHTVTIKFNFKTKREL